jgi:hypothetical protein
MLTVFRPRVFAKAITHRTTPELAAFCNHPLARLQVDILAEQQRRGRRIYAQHRQLLRVRIRRQGGKATCRYDHPLPPGEAAKWRQDPVADLDAPHPRPYGENPADAFIADDGWKRGADCIDALCDHEVVRVDGGKFDADEDLVGAGSVGLGNVGVLKTVDRVAK